MALNKEDEFLLLYSVRYALGRRSTAPLDVSEAVRRNWDELSGNTRELILKEVSEALRRALPWNTLGDDCDHGVWTDLAGWMTRKSIPSGGK